MIAAISKHIDALDVAHITLSRKQTLQPLIDYIQSCVTSEQPVLLHFICTHNSRRSHLGQIWAQTMASYYAIAQVTSFSGGTEATALFPKIAQTIQKQGFKVTVKEEGNNPLYAIQYDDDSAPILCFSKVYDHYENPQAHFAAIMTCDHASENCPIILGATARIPITYLDPKQSDGTPQQDEVYYLKSLEIATELKYVFAQIVK